MKISAVIPAYNSAVFISEAIASIRGQSHPVDEIIVIDDGSSDNTATVVASLGAGITYFKQSNQGPSAARNQGINIASGDWIAFLDADDQWTPDKIAQQIVALQCQPSLQLIAGDMAETGPQGNILVDSVLAKHHLLEQFQTLAGRAMPKALAALVKKNFIPTGTVLARRSVLLDCGGFNPSIRFGEDLELWAKIASRHPITCLPEVLMLRRQHGANATQNTGPLLEDLVKVMGSIATYAKAELQQQGTNPNTLTASALADLGYWYFSQADYQAARRAFYHSLKQQPSKRALLYATVCLLPHTLIKQGKTLKQCLASKPIDHKIMNVEPQTTPPPKKILYVENGIGYGGAIICLRHLVRNLDRSRFTPMVVTGRTGPQYREIASEAQWQHIADRHLDIVGAHQKLDPITQIDKAPGLRFVVNQVLARADDLFNFLPFFLHLLWTAWRFKADLIHANNEPLCNRAALLVGKVLKIPTVCHVRGDQHGSRLMSWAYSLVSHFTPVSHWVSASIQSKLDVPENKISVIYDGLELDGLNPSISGQPFRQQYRLTDDDFAVGLVGLLIPWKGQEIFIDAAKQLQNAIPNLKMLIIGGTPDDCLAYEQMLKARVAAEGLGATVIFTGHISDMPMAYNALNIVVSASTSPEPLGTVVIESMALGRPLIGPNHGGAAEMIEHNKTGLLFEHGDATSLAQHIKAYYADSSLGTTLGAAARAHALSTFAVASHVEKIQNLYQQTLHTACAEHGM